MLIFILRTSFTCKITDFGFFHVFELPIFSILVCAAAAGASLGVGIRSARKYTKESKVAGYSQARLVCFHLFKRKRASLIICFSRVKVGLFVFSAYCIVLLLIFLEQWC